MGEGYVGRMNERAVTPAVAAGARVQRRTEHLPVLHLEPEVPASADWVISVDGLVADAASWSITEITGMVREERVWDLHCVWGWTRQNCRWEGIPAARLIDAARPLPEASHVLTRAMGDDYAACLTLERARRSLLAWRLDGADLTPEHGWPLRLVPPPTKWAYKGVKWVTHLTLLSGFRPGFWEELVGDPHGDIPPDILDHLEAT